MALPENPKGTHGPEQKEGASLRIPNSLCNSGIKNTLAPGHGHVRHPAEPGGRQSGASAHRRLSLLDVGEHEQLNRGRPPPPPLQTHLVGEFKKR